MAEDKPLIQRQPGTKKDDTVFDVGRAYESGEVAGTFVSDKKRKGVFGQLKAAAKEVTGSATAAIKKEAEALTKEPEKPKVTPGTERKDIIERAVQSTEQAPKDDHDVVVERIRTFQKDAERVSGKPYLIKKNKDQVKSSWSHILGDKPAENTEEEEKPAPKVTETIRRTPTPKMPQEMGSTVIPPRTPVQEEVPKVPEPVPVPAPEPKIQPVPQPTPAPPKPPQQTTPPKPAQDTPATWPRTLGIIGGGIVVAALVLGGGYYLYNLLTTKTSTTVTQEPLDLNLGEYLPVEQLATLPVRIDSQETIRSRVTVTAGLGETEALPATSFLMTVAENVPNMLVRSLSEEMAIGGVRTGAGVYPYLIFRTNNFDNTFAGMLSWEGTLGGDLNELFTRAKGDAFVDRVVSNHHIRVLYDVNGIERLVYGLIDGRMLIITATSAAFEAVASGL